MDSTNFTKNIVKALENLGGEALLHEIYDEFKRICDEQGENLSGFNKYNGIDNWKSSIRRRLQQHSSTSSQYIKNKPDLFVGPSKIKKGLWALKDNKNSVYVIAYYLSKFLENDVSKNNLKENYKKILTVFSPILPHIIFECLESLNCEVFQAWPHIDKKLLEVENIEFVIQINGKKKAILSATKDIDEKTLMDQIKKDVKMGKIFEEKQINKVFFVKNRLINILTK